MTANGVNKKQCVTCSKSGGILICDGCQKPFCGKHVIEHRQDLASQLDNIMQEHDLLQQEIEQPSSRKNSLLQKIDRWEKDSMLKIQISAENARRSLLDLLQQAKGPLSKIYDEITEDLHSAREADDFSEYDLERWKKQLKDLELQVTYPPAAKLLPDKNSPIYLMQLHITESSTTPSASRKEPLTNPPNSAFQERFLQSLGPVRFEENGYIARHTSPVSDYAYIRGRLLYLRGSHTIRFRLEKCKAPYYIFFGCMSSKVNLQEDAFRLPSSVGWFGSNQAYEQGRCSRTCKKSDFNSNKIQTHDILQLTLDCSQLEVRLHHERMKTTCILGVDPKFTPFPWQLLVVLCNPGDAIRILPNS